MVKNRADIGGEYADEATAPEMGLSRRLFGAAIFGAALPALAGCANFSNAVSHHASAAKKQVLIFSHTTGYRHASIEPATIALTEILAAMNIDAVHSEDPAIFAGTGLAPFSAIILLSCSTQSSNASTEWLDDAGKAGFMAFAQRGGGIVGLHAAADSHYNWPWWGGMIGGRFERHPPGMPMGQVRVVAPDSPIMKDVPLTMERPDEWYYFADFDPTVNVLAVVDPATIGQSDVNPNPLIWTHEYGGARVFYSALGHAPEAYSEAYYVRILRQGMAWVLGQI